MSSTIVTASPSRAAMRDPVLLLPAVVAAGLAIAWLGVHEQIAGWRIAADVGVAWALVAASVVALDRPRWQHARRLLAAAGFALLAADLEWAGAHALSTLGFVLDGLWAAVLVQLVLTFPEGRRWSRLAPLAIAGAYAATLGGQLVGALVLPDGRDVLSVASDAQVARAVDRIQAGCASALALVTLVAVAQRLHALRGPARRAQGPLLVGALVTIPPTVVWSTSLLASGSAATTSEIVARGFALCVPLGVTAGIVWSRLRRSEASELVVELRADTPTGLRERLAGALGDPTLEVAYRLADGRYVDANGLAVVLPQGPDRAVTAVTVGGEEVAVLVHDPALLDEPALVESVRAAAALVLENERLAAEVRSQLAEVRASRGRIVAAADAERRRIERNLHDGAQQRLVTLSVALALDASHAEPAAAAALSRAQDEVEQAIAELRELARGIHPTLLREEGLPAAVAALARRTPVPVSVRSDGIDRLAETIELAAYFVVSETLTNVVKHASATEASVVLEQAAGVLRVAVADDGRGGARISGGGGLAGLRDRLEAFDAALEIESAPGRGTIVRAEFPCAS
jgi:signal transduction histidine kinase